MSPSLWRGSGSATSTVGTVTSFSTNMKSTANYTTFCTCGKSVSLLSLFNHCNLILYKDISYFVLLTKAAFI